MIRLFAGLSAPAAIGGLLRSDDAVLRATTFWEFPIRTLYREFPESRALCSPQSPRRHAVDRGPGVRQRASGARRRPARFRDACRCSGSTAVALLRTRWRDT